MLDTLWIDSSLDTLLMCSGPIMDSTFSGWQDPYYRALFDNPAYGICRADRFGKFAEVNQTLVSMLGYESAEDLGASELQFDLNGSNPAYDQLFGKHYPEGQNTPYLELEWKRKDGVPIKVRISGRAVHVANGEIHGYQLIVENIDEQRALEQQLRSVAHTDGLTGLPNYRALEDVLQGELRRAGRTGRGFSLLLLDVDGMKAINDASGHLQGNR